MTNRLEQLRRLHDADPSDPFVPYGMALEYAKIHQFDDALRWLDQTLQVDPQYCYAYYHKAKILSERGSQVEAKAVLTQGIQTATQAGDDHARSEMAELLEAMG